MAKQRIIVLGAGLAGLSAAWHLQKRGINCVVFEKESEVGGLCRSKHLKGFTFDYDGHLLHFKHRYTFNLIKKLLNGNLIKHERNAWVYHFDRYIRYPFQANLSYLPDSILKECLLEFLKVSLNGHKIKKHNANFLQWLHYTFGKGIVRHFMIPYNFKFWTIPLKELTCEWLDGFIPQPSLTQVIAGAATETQEQFGYNATFWYPKKGGIDNVPKALARQIRHIHTDCPVCEINLKNKEITFASGEKERFDILISTIPLFEIPSLIRNLPIEIQPLFKKLRWNSILNLNLGISGKRFQNRHWIYFPQEDIIFFRVGFPHNFSSDLTPFNMSSLYVEVAYSKDKPIDKDKIAQRIFKDLKKVGLLSSSDNIRIQDINDIRYGYPIYDRNYKNTREEILNFLKQKSIICCGRYGSWRYMSMEDTLLDAKNVAMGIKK